MRKFISATVLLALVGLVLSGAPGHCDLDPCLKLRMGLDIGSGSTKIRSGIVNVCTQVIVEQIERVSLPIPFKDHLSRENSNGLFAPEFIDKAVQAIASATQTLKQKTLERLNQESRLATYQPLASLPIEVAGVATEAFRQAKNTSLFVAAMKKEQIQVEVLTQVQEGHIGFIGALALLGKQNVKPQEIVAWDIGGGSLQIARYRGVDTGSEPWLDFGNQLASNPMRIFVVKEFLGKPVNQANGKMTSPNPILNPSATHTKASLLEVARPLVEEEMSPLVAAGWLKASPATVYGIGGVHGGVLSLLKTLPGYSKTTSYTQADLVTLLDHVLSASDQDLINQFKVPEAYTSGSATNVLLVYLVMATLGIDEVQVLDVDNTLGALTAPKFWPEVKGMAIRAVVNP